MNTKLRLLALLSGLCVISACSQDPSEDPEQDMATTTPAADMSPSCISNEVYNPILGKCVPSFEEDMTSSGDMTSGNTGSPDMPATDMAADMATGECFETLLYVDNDGDGRGVDDPSTNIMECLRQDQEKPGYSRKEGDCDDENRLRSPNAAELCDEIDNNCDGELNEGLDCVFYAHGPGNAQSPQGSQGVFYTIDPFKKKVEYIGEIYTKSSLLDIDSHPDGKIYGISAQHLYRYTFVAGEWLWAEVGELQADLQGANGLAIDRSGDAYATARDELYSVNLGTGRAQKLGNLTGGVNSSGDCVVNKGDILYMTSKKMNADLPDDLIKINRTNNTTEVVGTTSHSRIFGLTAAWGKLFGVTANGDLIAIDQGTGASTLIQTFEGRSFYGAASTPGR